MTTESIAVLSRQLVELSQRTDGLVADLDRRVGALEQQLQVPAASQPPPPPTMASAGTATPPPPPPGPADAITVPPVVGPAGEVGPVSRPITAEDVLRLAGVVLVGLAAIFLVSTAITRGWIGPELQLLGATVIGAGLLGAAVHLVDRARTWAVTFGIAGSVVVTTCAGAAYGWLSLVSPEVALALVAVAAGVATAVAARLRSELVAVAATAAMLIVPPFAQIITDGSVPVIGIWLGLFAMVAAAVGIDRQWPLYRLVSTWAAALWVFGLAVGLAIDNNTDHLAGGSLLVAVVGLVLWLGPVLADRLTKPTADRGFDNVLHAVEHRGLAAIPTWSWWSVTLMAGLEFQAGGARLGLVMAAGFAAVALLTGQLPAVNRPAFIPPGFNLPTLKLLTGNQLAAHLMGAGLLVTISLVLWLGGPVLVVTLAAQGLITIVMARWFDDRLLTVNGVALSGLAWVLLGVDLLERIEQAIDLGAADPVGDHLAGTLAVGLLGIAVWLFGRDRDQPIKELANGCWWLVAVLAPVSMVAPVIDGRLWFVVATAAAVVSAVAVRWLGRAVRGIGGAIGVVTVGAAAFAIADAAARGLDGRGGISIVDHLAHLVVVAAVVGVAAWLWNHRAELLMRAAVATAWVMSLGWLASVLASVPQAQVAISAGWAVCACGAIVAWVRTGRPVIRVLGFATLAVVLTKLLTVDLAEVETLWRVGLFLVIGLALLRLGYVLPGLVDRYAPADSTTDGAQRDQPDQV